ncbi:MAG: YkgJ family cysteine cluster protein [Planctomycetota bacterium]
MKKLPMWVRETEGLRFSCTGCGDCCRGAEGYVWVGGDEVRALAEHLELSVKAFGKRYLRRVDGQLSLVDKPGPLGDCIFWDDAKGCTVYDVRPTQCRTFPFWPENLTSRRAWVKVRRECPGVGMLMGEKDGVRAKRLYSPNEVEAILLGQDATDVGKTRIDG